MTKPLSTGWGENLGGLALDQLKLEAARRFRLHSLPASLPEWLEWRSALREKIWRALGVSVEIPNQPPVWRETGRLHLDGYSVAKIWYESRPGILVTGNLYLPEGPGPFPAVITMHGHWLQGRLAARIQERCHRLAKSGYVCLAVDALGAGERSTEHGHFEYHGGLLGASLMNIGETLMGAQVADNWRGVDLLCSLPTVDASRIGATGASGGGNQTMWLAALDDRIQAALPVVSVGTFESYVGASNCVCELLPGGLEFTEEAGVLALVAPRALKICNCSRETTPAFSPAEMLRSYQAARRIFQAYGADESLSYEIFDLAHGYWPEVQEVMLGFFDRHLKGAGPGARGQLPEVATLPEEELLVFPKGHRPTAVGCIAGHCQRRGAELHREFLARTSVSAAQAVTELRELLRLQPALDLKAVHQYPDCAGWGCFSVEGSDGNRRPALVRRPATGSSDCWILSSPRGKAELESTRIFAEARAGGAGIVLFDPFGLGAAAEGDDGLPLSLPPYHTLARSQLWLGRTLLGEWALDFQLVARFAERELGVTGIILGGVRDAALAALFAAALDSSRGYQGFKLEDAPLSLRFHKESPPRFLTMAAFVPGFLKWGDVSLACALAGATTEFISPRHSDGAHPTDEELAELRDEFDLMAGRYGRTGTAARFVDGRSG